MDNPDPARFYVTVRNFIGGRTGSSTEEVTAHRWEIMNGGTLVFFYDKRVVGAYSPSYWLDFNEEKSE